MKLESINTAEMEIAVAKMFNPRVNLVIPNVHWGFLWYEADLIIITKGGYLYEVEIKISKSDLKKDLEKRHKHDSKYIKYLYFAIPQKLEKFINYIPDKAGIISVHKREIKKYNSYEFRSWENLETEIITCCNVIRQPKKLYNYKIDDKERYRLARLGALRIWNLKSKIIKTKFIERE